VKSANYSKQDTHPSEPSTYQKYQTPNQIFNIFQTIPLNEPKDSWYTEFPERGNLRKSEAVGRIIFIWILRINPKEQGRSFETVSREIRGI
jgi:antirestriction protein ArdC